MSTKEALDEHRIKLLAAEQRLLLEAQTLKKLYETAPVRMSAPIVVVTLVWGDGEYETLQSAIDRLQIGVGPI